MNAPTRLFDFPRYQLEHRPIEDALCTKFKGTWFKVSSEQYVAWSEFISYALMNRGIGAGDKVALISTTNRYEWNILDIGILQTGAVDVPVYPTASEEDWAYIFNDAGVKLCFVSDRELYDKALRVKEQVPSLEMVWMFDEEPGVPNWKEVLEEGKANPQSTQLKERMDAVKPHELATLIYTSGTTGRPKGVMLSHSNLVSNVLDVQDRLPVTDRARSLSFLPLCHVYERMLIYLYAYNSVRVYYAESMDTIGDNLREVKPEIFTAVPRLLEKVFDKIMAKGAELSGIKRALFFWAVGLAEEYDIHGKSGWYKMKLSIARKLIFSKWQEALGGEARAVASGSAALNPRLCRIFLAAGINVQEGYGLTETSPVISVNCPTNDGTRIGTVGRIINNVEVKIAEDGEILCKGPNVMMGYYNKPEQTAEVIDADGWFHTGDIGTFVEGQYLKITDRKKEIFKTSGGKYIAPQMLENTLKESRFIEQAMVIGEGEKFPGAFIQPEYVFIREWGKRHGLTLGSNEEIANHPQVIARIGKEVERLNQNLGKWEQIKKFELTPDQWSIDAGHLTPTMKLKRKVIREKYNHLYTKIYSA